MSFYRKRSLAAVTSTTSNTVAVPFGSTNYMAESVISGASVSVQYSGSNDNSNFTNIGSAVTSTDRVVPLNQNNEVYKYLKVTSTITGTGSATNTFYFA